MTLNEPKRTEPTNGGLMDPRFVYTNAASTDVLKTFIRFGWTPPSTLKDKPNAQ
jgi:hypothetical protein